MDEEILSGAQVAVEELKIEPVVEAEEAEASEVQAEGEKIEKKKVGGWQRKLTKLERENAELRQRLENAPITPVVTVKADTPKPQLNDYNTHEEWVEALTDWKYEVKQAARDEKLTKAQIETKAKEVEGTWESKIEALGEEEWSDYQNLVKDYEDIDLRTQIVKSAKESAIGPQILLHLDKNPDLFDKLNHKDTSDLTIKRAIRSIEAQLSNPASVKISKSPAPINPVKKSSPSSVDLSSMSTDDYVTQRMNRKK